MVSRRYLYVIQRSSYLVCVTIYSLTWLYSRLPHHWTSSHFLSQSVNQKTKKHFPKTCTYPWIGPLLPLILISIFSLPLLFGKIFPLYFLSGSNGNFHMAIGRYFWKRLLTMVSNLGTLGPPAVVFAPLLCPALKSVLNSFRMTRNCCQACTALWFDKSKCIQLINMRTVFIQCSMTHNQPIGHIFISVLQAA